MNSAERREARYQRRKAARMKKKAAALREYGDFETVFSFERLYESYRASVRGVGWKASTQRYKAASLANVTKTHEELIAGRYRSKGFYEFDIVERGKPTLPLLSDNLPHYPGRHHRRSVSLPDKLPVP